MVLDTRYPMLSTLMRVVSLILLAPLADDCIDTVSLRLCFSSTRRPSDSARSDTTERISDAETSDSERQQSGRRSPLRRREQKRAAKQSAYDTEQQQKPAMLKGSALAAAAVGTSAAALAVGVCCVQPYVAALCVAGFM